MSTPLESAERDERLSRYVRILKILAESDVKLNKNRIWTKLELENLESEPTILYAIDDLEKWGMVKLIKTSKAVPGGKTFNYYTLTRTGVENLITAGFIRTQSLEPGTIQFLLRKYRELLPYAAGILEMWPIFTRAKVEDIAAKRLALFILGIYGEQLYHYVGGIERAGLGPPRVGSMAIVDMLIMGSYSRDADDDLETFVNPSSPLHGAKLSSSEMDENVERWNKMVNSTEKLKQIVIRAGLKKAYRLTQNSNETLRSIGVKPIVLKESDPQTYRKFLAEIKLLQAKFVIPSS